VRDVIELGADRERVAIANITPLVPEQAPRGDGDRPDGRTRYLFVGRLIERKGLDVLLDAFARVRGGELHIVGDGPLRPLAEAAAARDPRISMVGHLSGDPLVQAYREADALVVPSLYEPWGLVVHEGLAHGLPVITTDQVGAADDLVDPGVNGYIVRAGSSAELSDTMDRISAWTPDRFEEARRGSAPRLAAFSVQSGAEGFIRGCTYALEHRREREMAHAGATRVTS
jgi:glycosyltransferase involved in cell wall biosynthesis